MIKRIKTYSSRSEFSKYLSKKGFNVKNPLWFKYSFELPKASIRSNRKLLENDAVKIDTLKNEIILCFDKIDDLIVLSDEFKRLNEDILANELIYQYNNYNRAVNYEYSLNNKSLSSKKINIMGILNITEDSFYDGGRYSSKRTAYNLIDEMCDYGIDIIDIGAESTRPGSEPIKAKVELKKIIPILKYARKKKIIISIDTYKSEVADECLKLGADIINDISGLTFDNKMPETISKHICGIVLMHIKGTPQNMQVNPSYKNVIDEIFSMLHNSINICKKYNIKKIFIDPGIGFGKRLLDNYSILNKLEEFLFLGYPILIGTSRKSFIGKVLNQTPDERLIGSLTSNIMSVMNGANILRVHDFKETIDSVTILKYIINPYLIRKIL